MRCTSRPKARSVSPRAARARKLPFTTAYHTRFPEYVQARFGIPLAATYRFLHGSTRRRAR
jgi:hypothetical protein